MAAVREGPASAERGEASLRIPGQRRDDGAQTQEQNPPIIRVGRRMLLEVRL